MVGRPHGEPPVQRRRRRGQVTDASLKKLGLTPAKARKRRGDEVIPGGTVIGDVDSHIRVKLGELAETRGRKLPTIPGIQSLSLATRHLNGGREHFIELVQLAALNGSNEATLFMAVLASLLPSERIRANYDEVCVAAGVRPSQLVGAVTSAAMEYGADVGNLVYAASHPKVVAAGIAAAMRPEGTKDREQLFQHQGFIPVPRSATINVSAHASADAKAAAAAQGHAEAAGLPSFAADIAAIGAGRVVEPRAIGPAVEAEGFEVVEEREPSTVGERQ